MRKDSPSLSSRARRARHLVFILALLVGLLLATSCQRAPEPASAFAAVPLTVATEADWIDLERLNQRLQQEKQKGRVVMVNYWATWCEPCREEFPDLIELQRRHAGRGLRLLSISLDSPKERETAVRDFLAEQRPVFPVFIKTAGDPDEFINAIDPDWSGALPATFIYDRAGHRRHALIEKQTFASLEQLLRPLLQVAPTQQSFSWQP
jgi:thiol-disulfide isomerase/thioredoxin